MIDPAQPGPRIIINAMPLETYRSKRNFKATPEPEGQATKRKAQQLSFVVQKHAASHLHYDFRLELNGVLLSWAIPKGPSLDPKDKRLAVHVEDHPIEYGSFEGVIPPKQYGSGTVMLWDRGVWLPKDDPSEGYRKGKLKFDLHGQKLMGGWTLVRSHGAKYGDRAWLLIKEDDAFARRGAEALIGEVQPHSAASGRSLDEIAADPERVWHSNKSLADNVANNVTSGAARSSKPRFSFAKVAGAIKRAMPEMIEPQLATLVRDAPSGDQWMHELKYDGYRMLCRIERGQARMISRSGRDWTDRFAPIARAAARLPVSSCWMDGEVVALEPDGRSSFQELQNALAHQSAARLQYVLFDLLVCDGWDLRGAALTERKRLLEQLLSSAPAPLKYSVHVQGSGPEFLEQAARLGLEGVVSKHAEANYQAGRTRQWLKIKCEMRQEMVIGGFTNPEGSRAGFGALLLGVYQADGTLRYSGKVGTGFNDAVLASLHQRLLGLVQKAAPFSNPPKGAEARRAHWVAPQLVAEIAFTEWTDEGTLRHAVFLGLREDKQASEVVRERPRGSLTSQAAASRSVRAERGTSAAATIVRASNHRTASSKSSDMIAGVKLTNPDKLLYPDAKLSKRDLALYYETVGERIVAHLRDRPLTLLRHPNGWDKPGFYQKHADETVHEAIERVTVQDSDGPAIYMMANSVSAVVALLQLGALELHPWGARADRLAFPDRIVFDLDPDDGLAWSELVQAAQLVKTLLEKIELQSFLRTTGGKGLHVVVPIEPVLRWDAIKGFTKAVAELLARTFPERFTANLAKASRRGKIFVDYLRNAEGATAIASYSLRARAGAPVALPIAWEEVRRDVRFDHFNARNVPARLKRLKQDPWAEFFAVKQSVTSAMMAAVGYAAPETTPAERARRWRR